MARLFLALYLLIVVLPAFPPPLFSQDIIAILQSYSNFKIAVSRLLQHVTITAAVMDGTMDVLRPGSTGIQRAQVACDIINTVFPGTVTVADDPEYEEELQFNWSRTCWLRAACVFRPTNAAEVSAFLSIVKLTASKFSVRGGGHNPNSGFNSVDSSGILVDMRGFDTLALEGDLTLRVGSGQTWKKVYEFIERDKKSVIGGRHGTVGVGGFLLGGGMPFFGGLYGMAADNVKNFQVVTSDSRIINANINENQDLFRALKGGGTNFGIVTRFDMEVYDLIKMQYTVNAYHASDYANLLNATVNVQKAMEFDNKIGFFLNVHPTVIIAGLLYAEHTAQPPKAFTEFFNAESLITSIVPTTNGTVQTIVPELDTVGQDVGPASRALSSVSTKEDYELYLDVHKQYTERFSNTPEMPSATLSYTIQPVSSFMVRAGRERGGNSMGLAESAQTWWACLIEWYDGADTAKSQLNVGLLGDTIASLAGQRGDLLPFQFMNDAGSRQKVLQSYGKTNLATLTKVAVKYDKAGTFQTLQNAGFLVQ